MTDAVTILRQNGMGLADECVQAAVLENVDIAVAATILQKESGGRNVWGSDPGSTGGAYVKGSTVTQHDYLAYRAAVQAGRIGRQGVGPMQCTSSSYQSQADALGGAWLPVPNMRSGLRGLGNLIRAYGIRDGARRYNGSGPAAEAYAADFMNKYAVWKQRLSGASVPSQSPEDDDMTPAQSDQLAAIAAHLASYDTLNKDLRSDLDDKHKELDLILSELRTDMAALTAKVDALAVKS